jgi:predicted ATPase/DNA-binding winged helix-turn-helix (wHTH) protein
VPTQGPRLIYRSGPWEVDLARRELLARGVPVPLGSRAFEIIEVLVRAAGALVNKDDLIRQVWPGEIVGDNTLQVHVHAVRRALGPDRGLLKTAFGRGYRLLGAWTIQPGDLASGLPALPLAASGPVETAPAVPAPEQPYRNNLPLATSDLIGRAAAMQQVMDLLSEYRVVTLTGPGGIGKTVLALEVARRLFPSFQGDIWLVDLTALSDPALVPTTAAGVLDLRLGGDKIPPESVARAIGGRRLLLVFDNCEHVINAASELVEAIVRMCPHASVLATSREILRIEGEYVYRVPPLAVPPEQPAEPGDVLGHAAAQLFIARARAQDSACAPGDDDLSAIAGICRRLDGIPLAIEFAAARAAALGLPEVAAHLDDRFDLLTDGRRTALPRHQTLRATLDWSYGLLPEPEQRLLRRLAVFRGGSSLEAVAAVMQDADDAATVAVHGIANLVAKSLVGLDGSAFPERWRLLETVRAYASEKLTESGETEQVARYHAEFFRDLFARTAPDTQPGVADQGVARDGREIDNVRAALDWAFAASGDPAIGIDLTAAYVSQWTQLSLFGECRSRVETALAVLDRGSGHTPRNEMILRAAHGMSLAYTRGPVDQADCSWQRVLELAEGLDDTEYQLRALYGRCMYKTLCCEHRTALALTQQFRRVAERPGHQIVATDISTADRMMAVVLHYLGDQAGARSCADRSLAGPIPANRQIYSMRYGIDQRVGALVQLSRILWLQGFPEQATQAAQASVDEAAAVGHANSMCLALADGACIVTLLCGDLDAAGRFAVMLTEHADKHDLGVWRIYGRAVRGRVLARDGRVSDGLALLRSALADVRKTPLDMRLQLYLIWLAQVLGVDGQVVEALSAIDEALERAERTEEVWYLAELLRIRGELLLQRGESGSVPAAREMFAESLRVAQRQKVLSLELRTTMSMVRLGRGAIGAPELRALLEPVLAGFTEGMQTADLVAARHLLAELDC